MKQLLQHLKEISSSEKSLYLSRHAVVPKCNIYKIICKTLNFEELREIIIHVIYNASKLFRGYGKTRATKKISIISVR